MMQKTITAAETSYTLGTITTKTAKASLPLTTEDGKQLDSREFNRRLIAASLVAGGADPDTVGDVVDEIPLYLDNAFGQVFQAALDVNGMRVEKASGEAGAGEEPASTGSISTANSL